MAVVTLVGAKPVAWAGQEANVTLSGISSGTDLTLSLDGQTVTPTTAPEWRGDTTVTVMVPVSNVNSTTIQPLTIDLGSGGTFSVNVTVIPDQRDVQFVEDPVYLEMFEDSAPGWETAGWLFDTLDTFISATHDLNGKQRFTRHSGKFAAAIGTGTRTLRSPAVRIPGPGYELRFASHYTTSGGTSSQLGTVTVSYNGRNNQTILTTLSSTDETNLIRGLLSPPTNNATATFTFTFQDGGEESYWMIDDVEIVKPLSDVSGEPLETIDIISDIQGTEQATWMQQSLLPVLRNLNQASTLVVNGDLVHNDDDEAWTDWSAALGGSGARDYYSNIISVAGNHEMFTESYTSAEHIDRFVQNTNMSTNFGQEGNGLWGEHITDSGTPIIWLASQFYTAKARSDNPPYVTLEDNQFLYLADRLAYWRTNKRAVLLFAHHPLPYSVSGTWDQFDANTYGEDEPRFRYLLAANPHAMLITSHTHYDISAVDQNVNHRPVVGHPSTVTTFNTGATINYYDTGGKDDFTLYEAGDKSPTGLQAEVYGDRIRIKAYRFDDLSTTGSLIHTRDVGFPVRSTTLKLRAKPEPAASSLVSKPLSKPALAASPASRTNVELFLLCASLAIGILLGFM